MSCIVFSSAHELSRPHSRSTGKKERRFIESVMPADGTSAARCAHGDLGTSRLRAAEANVTRRLARVKEAPRPSASHRRNAARPFLHPRLDLGRPEIVVGDILERDGHDLACPVDRHMAEELQPEAGREVVALRAAAPLLNTARRPKVLSSVCGRQVPAWSGPEMNSQNGSKSWN